MYRRQRVYSDVVEIAYISCVLYTKNKVYPKHQEKFTEENPTSSRKYLEVPR